MKDPITKLEAATEGSRDLDREIQEVVDTPRMGCPYFTTSLDAAMTIPGAEELIFDAVENVAKNGFYPSKPQGAIALELSKLTLAALKARG